MDKIAEVVNNKGFLVGIFMGILLVLKSITDGNFNYKRAIAVIPSSAIIGYVSYSIAVASGIDSVLAYGWTVIVSLNSFFVVELLTDKAIMQSLVDKYITPQTKEKVKDE